ncbi:MAG: flagellar protein FlgN [Pseudobdellovibrionaceae bacterium]
MDASQEKSYQRLVANLEELTKLYRSLLETVRKEKDLLIAADITKLNENNKEKEALLYKVRSLDGARERYAKEFANHIGADANNPRLLDLAKALHGTEYEQRLRNIHSMLEMLVTRVSGLNKENEEYAQSALNTLNGAMGNIKETLAGKKTYARQGKMEYGPDKAGNFVRKEA